MDQALKQLIIENYKTSLENINEIISGKVLNCFVLKPQQYLTPSIICKNMPLEDEYGEFYHYNKICETLEKLLAGEKADYNVHLRNAPEKIVQLLHKEFK
jgi:hypothetical protein